jgi:hypothetical protein
MGSCQKKRYFYELAPRFLPTNAITIRYGVIQDVGRRPHLETIELEQLILIRRHDELSQV